MPLEDRKNEAWTKNEEDRDPRIQKSSLIKSDLSSTLKTSTKKNIILTIKGNCILYHKQDEPTQTYKPLKKNQFIRLSALPDTTQGRATNLIPTNQVPQANHLSQSYNNIPLSKPSPRHITEVLPFKNIDEETNVGEYIESYADSTRITDVNLNSNITCPICRENLSTFGTSCLKNCEHYFHTGCLENLLKNQASPRHLTCPLCHTVHGIKTGNMPLNSKMWWWKECDYNLPGTDKHGTFFILYHVESGTQGKGHPYPGKPFKALGFPRGAMLPGNNKGKRVLNLLCLAFRRRLTFTVKQSLSKTSEEEYYVAWGGIQHKTSTKYGSFNGYPDINYLEKVTAELENLGVK